MGYYVAVRRLACPFALAASLAACRHDASPARDDAARAAALPVTLAPVDRGEVARPIHAAGFLRSRREADLGFLEGGHLTWVGVEPGDHVRRGQRLARVDAGVLDADRGRTASLLQKARRDLARARDLHGSGALASAGLEDARTGERVANAGARAAQFAASHAIIFAPEDGVIEARYLDPGTVVAAGVPVLRFGGRGQGVVVRSGLPDRDAIGLEIGRAAHVTLDARPGETLDAFVSWIAPAATPGAGTFEVEVKLASPPAGLFDGLTAKIAIDRVEHPAASVPLSSLVAGDDRRTWVFSVVAGKAHKQGVRVAFLYDDRAALAEAPVGLTSVVGRGAATLSEGAEVREVSSPAQASR